MARGRLWTPEEDAEIRAAARLNREHGLRKPHAAHYRRTTAADFEARLKAVGPRIQRSYSAVQARAQRIGAICRKRRR